MSSIKSASPLDDSLIFQYQVKLQRPSRTGSASRTGINRAFAVFVLCVTFIASMHAQQSPAERVAEIQAALRDAKLDGWLFYDFRHSDPLAYRILKLDENMFASRRWFYYVPASGEPVKIVQSIEQFKLRRYSDEGMQQEPMIVAVNANTANPHYMPTKEKNSPIRRGDFVLIDAATKLNKPEAVATDQTWTGYVGEAVPEEYSRIFNIVREARDSAIDFVRKNIRAGKPIRGAEVDDVSRGVIKRAGFGEQFTHRTGHSIGEETHGNGVNIDDFETRDSRRIIPGVCFSIEPGIYLEGKFGVRSEIDVYVSDKDVEVTGQPIQTEIIPILKR